MEVELRKKLRGVEDKLAGVKEKMRSLRKEEKLLLSERTELDFRLKDALEAKTCAFVGEDWLREKFPWSSKVRELLSRFDLSEFRPLQLESINIILSGHDLLLIMPTGGGKSLCYQIPGLVKQGVCLVVSPLISLMEDQTLSLTRIGVRSSFLSANTSRDDATVTYRELSDPSASLKFLFVTPERVSKSKKLISCLEKAHAQSLLSLIVVDEVHCASQWGHDFRPDYKKLSILKLQFPSVPILGLTATATGQVLADVEDILSLSSPRLLRTGFNRRNLFFEVRAKPEQLLKQVEMLVAMIQLEFCGDSGIIYCLSKRDCENISLKLQENGLSAACYHADVLPHVRREVHLKWLNGDILIVVSTVAFGLGIDKKNVRFVIHHSLAKSVANYYQECGRAGRDGAAARCVLLYRPQDYFSHSCMVMTERTGICNLDAMARYCQDVSSCRRVLLAQHFNEEFQAGDCDMCDNCFISRSNTIASLNAAVSSSNFEVRQMYKAMIELIELAAARKERLTAAKLLTSWKKQYKSESKLLSDYACMCIIMRGLLDGIFREDYHFTPYNTISYLLVGFSADTLLSDTHGVLDKFEFRERNYELLAPLLRSHFENFTANNCSVTKPKTPIVISDGSSDSDEDYKFKSKRFCAEQSAISCDD